MATATSAAAVVGAFAGLASLGWQIFKYLKDGPILRIRVSQDMQVIGPDGQLEEQPWALVNIANAGSQPTTITHLFSHSYRGRFDRLLRKKTASTMVFPNPDPGRLSSKLAPGEIWTGMVKQDHLQELLEEGNHLFIGVYHAFSDHPKTTRLRLGGNPRETAAAESRA